MIKTIDHIIIHTPSAQDTLKEMEDIFGIQAYVPLNDYGHFKSAMLRFGNLDIEILEIGEKKDFEPYWYGIAFEPRHSIWETIDALEIAAIPHSLPSKTSVENKGVALSWHAIVLDKLLDNAIKVPCGIGYMYANNWLGKAIAKLTNKLMRIESIKKSAYKDVGSTMVFFCAYEPYPAKEREMASKALEASNGGNYALEKVQSIVINKEPSNDTWDKLTSMKDNNATLLKFENANVNEISHVVLQSKNAYNNEEIIIGKAKFIVQ